MSRLAWALSLGLAMTGIATFGQSETASPEAGRTITVHVYNYAEVDGRTLSDAEKVATEIFRKAGVESQWVDSAFGFRKHAGKYTDQRPRNLSDFHLNILSRRMAEHIPLKGDVMGVAPGTGRWPMGGLRVYNQVETFAARQTVALAERKVTRAANEPQILGHVIAHEIGHELLDLEGAFADGHHAWQLGSRRLATGELWRIAFYSRAGRSSSELK